MTVRDLETLELDVAALERGFMRPPAPGCRLECAVQDDPEPDDFEGWLLERCGEAESEGGVRAMALQIFEEWRMASTVAAFSDWLTHGAPSDDRES